ncbi:MAG TPA: GNAT family protein [Flavobacteriales bacterium]|nr:GNAT family protein [Flavobacteriales bacterium]
MLSVREIQLSDIPLLCSYWFDATPEYMRGMGVDLSKMPTRQEWVDMLTEQIETKNYADKKAYCMIWLQDGGPVGHSNINKIVFADHAYMHLHLWNAGSRKKGVGTAFVKLTVPHFFEKYQLKHLYSEPYALNPAPHRTLEKAGFRFVKEYTCVPGWINFEQRVKLWEFSQG